MARRLTVAIVAAMVGAAVAAVALQFAASAHPGVVFEMDRNLPLDATGIYPSEWHERDTWIWTAPRASITFAHADRDVAWTCEARVRGGRPPEVPLPALTVSVDGVVRAAAAVTNEFQVVALTVPAAPGRRGFVLGLDSSETFRPAGDNRALGVLVDRLACVPDGAAAAPAGSTSASAMAAALLGAAAGLLGAPLAVAAGVAVVTGALQALPLTTSGAALTAFPDSVPWIALWIAVALAGAVAVSRLVAGAPLSVAAWTVLAGSSGVLHLKLLGLLHPAKPIVDALYHAHRLDRVLNGQFYFTQIMPNGVEFPYAVALYVAAAPWTALTGDHVALLRIVAVAAEVAAGALLFTMASRARGDRVLGVFAVALFHAVPVAYPVLGNANLTNAFGQAAALAAVAAAVAMPLTTPLSLATLAAIVTVALLSHVSTLMLTSVTIGAFGVACWWLGGPALRPTGRRVLLALVVASLLSVGVYWGHFGDTYRTLAAVRAETADGAVPGAGVAEASPPETESRSMAQRVGTALRLVRQDLGLPMILLSLGGLVLAVRTSPRDRLALAIGAWGVAWLCFAGVGLIAPVSGSYERYAAEFIGRVDLAAYPAAVLLGAHAAAWLWRTGAAGRVAAIAFVLWVASAAFMIWRAWIQ